MTVSSFHAPELEESVYLFPASFAQERLWFLDQLEPHSAAYNIPSTIRIRGRLEVETLVQSLNMIVKRHEVLRATFRVMEGQLMQVIAPTLTLPMPVIDLQPLAALERETQALSLAVREAQCPFDLAQGPLVRATLLHLTADEHLLLLTVHHIIFDGWSIGILLQELATLYEAFSRGQPCPLPELPIQYVDFTIWQREWLQGAMLEAQLAYWKQQLEGAPAVLPLPTDHARPIVSSQRGSICPFNLSKRLTNALRTLSRQQGVTLYMTLLAAFTTLLHRYTGQDDLMLGSPVAGRTRVETEALIGFFVNMLALRTDLSGDPTFSELLGRVREVSLEAQMHQDVPFEYVVQALQPERHLGQNPLFQVLFSLQPSLSGLPSGWTPTQTLSSFPSGWTPTPIHTGTAKFDLSLICEDRPEGLVGWFEYSTDLFEATTIARLLGHWQTLLEGIVTNPEQCLSELPLLREAERQQMLEEWNATSTDYPKYQCVHQLFEAQVERTPHAIALVFKGKQLTYRDLNMQANQLAHRLQHLGVGPEVLVGLCMDRSLEMVVGLLGILKAGGAYVPLDPTYPKERLAFMLQDTHATVLLAQEHYKDVLPTREMHVICLDSEWKSLAQEPLENLVSEATAENLAYVMYTSGSTGKPKGVAIPHRAITRLVINTNYVQLAPSDRVAQVSNTSFDAATFEIWGALLHGAQLLLITKDIVLSPQDFAAQLQDQRITVMFLTTALFNLLASQVPSAFRSIRSLLFGGEAVDPKWVKEVLKHGPPAHLLHVYGPTECTTFTSWHQVQEVPEGAKTIPIGRPISNTQIYVLDVHLQPVPIGVPGELYIGGPGLARGYLNRRELTAERFIAHPFSDEPDACLYKTGDQARYLADGSIEFLGRLDHQVKIRGFRVEPGEIEIVLGQHTAVREVMVLLHEYEGKEKRLVAYIVPEQGQRVTHTELYAFLKERLPEYMVPSDFVQLDALPLTPNGKVDRAALPVPDLHKLTREETFLGPTSLVQYQLVQIWEDLLGVRPIGIRDNFFYLGGHSLLAARLVDRIEQAFGKKLALATLFAGPTIEQLAQALQAEVKEERRSRTPLVAVRAKGSRRPFFYLHGAWNSEAFHCFQLAHHLGPDQPFYALEPYHFDGLEVVPTLEDMAAAHLQQVRAIQPEGPYFLGGFCNGGLVAYEMARQLQGEGQRVDLLVLIDPAYSPVRFQLVHGLLSRVGKLMGLAPEKPLDWFLYLRHMYKYLRHERRLQDLKAFSSVDPSIQSLLPTATALRQDNIAIFNWLIATYNYAPYHGKVSLFWAQEEPFCGVWRRKAAQEKNIEVHIIPGTHLGCLTDHVQALAEELGRCLSKAQAIDLQQEELARQPCHSSFGDMKVRHGSKGREPEVIV